MRSQDRENLVKVDRLTIDDTNSIFCDYNDFYLGTYETKERALEVLDEIQKFIEEFQSVTAELNEYGEVTNVEHHKKVYEMPLD